jgi:hypothetical protein
MTSHDFRSRQNEFVIIVRRRFVQRTLKEGWMTTHDKAAFADALAPLPALG